MGVSPMGETEEIFSVWHIRALSLPHGRDARATAKKNLLPPVSFFSSVFVVTRITSSEFFSASLRILCGLCVDMESCNETRRPGCTAHRNPELPATGETPVPQQERTALLLFRLFRVFRGHKKDVERICSRKQCWYTFLRSKNRW